MVTPLTYAQFKTELASLAVVEEDNDGYVQNLPSAIDYAELRLYQDLQLLATNSVVTGQSLVSGSPTFVIPTGTFVVFQNANVITPSGQSDPNASNARRNSLVPVAKEWLQFVYNDINGSGVPRYMAMIDQNTVMVGPWPDANYALELIGSVRPASLSQSNQTTYLSTYLPTHLLYAAMIFISGYQRNFGRQSDDPQMAVSYESQYQTLLKGAATEEAMRRFQSGAWTAQPPAPQAQPPRA